MLGIKEVVFRAVAFVGGPTPRDHEQEHHADGGDYGYECALGYI